MKDFNKKDNFNFNWKDVQGNYMKTSATETKDKLDARDEELRVFLNGILEVLNSNEGADYLQGIDRNNIKVSIQEYLDKLDKTTIDLNNIYHINQGDLDTLRQHLSMLAEMNGNDNAEVVLSRFDSSIGKEYLTLYERLNDFSNKFISNLKNSKIFNDREIKYPNSENYGLDLANLAGQGLFPKNSPQNNKFRAMVIHNYVDTECMVIDNVGEMPSLFIRNARNPLRRTDKPSNFIPQSNFLQFQQAFMDKNPDGSEKDTHRFVTMFNMDYLGNMYWRDNREEVTSAKLQTVSQSLAGKAFAFTIGSYYDTRYIADFQYANNKSALKIARDTSGNTQIMTQLNGMKFSAYKGNTLFESIEGSVIFKGETGVYANVSGVNLPMAKFVATKPSSATAPGNKGDYFADSLNLYVCYNPDLWIKLDRVNW